MRRFTGLALLASQVACADPQSTSAGLSAGETTRGSTAASAGSEATEASITAASTTAASTLSAGDPTSESDGAATAATTHAATSDASTSAPIIDVGVDTDVDPAPLGCHGKIDLLFVIARNSAMSAHQEALAASIPEFMAVIDGALAAFDPQILITDGDDRWGNDSACTQATCPIDGGCAAIGADDYPCWALHDPDALGPCDRTFGAGVIFPAAVGASNHPCPFLADRRYLSRDDPDLAGAFACAATLGSDAGPPAVGHALFDASAAAINGPKGCNAGFLRDDALLVVTVILDAIDDTSDYYGPLAWAEQVHAAKGGDRDAVVVVGVVNDRDTVGGLCPGEPVAGPLMIRTMLGHFDHAIAESVCAPSYGDAFAAAAAEVLEICAGASG